MRAALWMLPLVLVGVNCAASTDVPEETSPPRASRGAPAGFEAWLSDRCPDGAVVGARNVETGEMIATATCEKLRDSARANASSLDLLKKAYVTENAPP